MSFSREANLGAVYLPGNTCRFRVWAPLAKRVEVHLLGERERFVPLQPQANGYHEAIVNEVAPGTRYRYRLDGAKERPDPASRWQPEGVHGPSAVVDPAFAWQATGWTGLPLPDYVIYELHVGTFTAEGTFDAAITRLDSLHDLGVTAIELMPVAQFPGSRNWGYDGVALFAPQTSYGGPVGLKRFVDACHRRGLAVVLDVVYNHLGPEGNYLWDYGPYFTQRHHTPWGPAVNFDGPDSDAVRTFFQENALYWLDEFRIDALRLDAVHAIKDESARPFLQELAESVAELARQRRRSMYLIAESNRNDVRLIRPREQGGFGLDAQWSDDFHHALHTLLTGECDGYYVDFGQLDHLARAYRTGFTYAGQYSPFRRRRHGNAPDREPPWRFVICSQNHDQVGNRMRGERLSQLVSFDALKLAAATVLLSPYLPLLFMGEEHGETAPFLFFTSHGDAALIEAVRKGRREEFAAFAWKGEVPDPQNEATFVQSKLRPEHAGPKGQALRAFHKELLRLRKTLPALANLSKEHLEVCALENDKLLLIRRWTDTDEVFLLLYFGTAPVDGNLPVPQGRWACRLDSHAPRWAGGGSSLPAEVQSAGTVALSLNAHAAALYQRIEER
jgi:maltooligosyltrehalose trehalohydrolase